MIERPADVSAGLFLCPGTPSARQTGICRKFQGLQMRPSGVGASGLQRRQGACSLRDRQPPPQQVCSVALPALDRASHPPAWGKHQAKGQVCPSACNVNDRVLYFSMLKLYSSPFSMEYFSISFHKAFHSGHFFMLNSCFSPFSMENLAFFSCQTSHSRHFSMSNSCFSPFSMENLAFFTDQASRSRPLFMLKTGF